MTSRRTFFRSLLGAVASLAIAQSIALEPLRIAATESLAAVVDVWWIRLSGGSWMQVTTYGDNLISFNEYDQLPFTLA